MPKLRIWARSCRAQHARGGRAERYRQSRKFYETVKAAKEDVAGLQPLYEELSEQFEGQGGDGSGGDAGGSGGGASGGGGTPSGGG